MIPYFEVQPIFLPFGYRIYPFGILVALACAVGIWLAKREARLKKLDEEIIDAASVWALCIGFVASSVVDVFLYNPDVLAYDPLAVFKFWNRMSSFGGFLGGSLAAVLYLRWRKQNIAAYVDCLVVGLIGGWILGRLGCALVHDHKGRFTDFVLAVRFPEGTRHDLGLYECLFALTLLTSLLSLDRTMLRSGVLTGSVCVAYGTFRFLVDFLRTEDRLYLGYTPGHYFSVMLVGLGAAIILRNSQVQSR